MFKKNPYQTDKPEIYTAIPESKEVQILARLQYRIKVELK